MSFMLTLVSIKETYSPHVAMLTVDLTKERAQTGKQRRMSGAGKDVNQVDTRLKAPSWAAGLANVIVTYLLLQSIWRNDEIWVKGCRLN